MTAKVEIRPIKTEADYDRALKAVEHLMDAEPNRRQATCSTSW